ncbi:MAG: PEP/pyruvate-binding domain-containing protein, partial [Phycisphaerae bacterium]|nr:PEP/pyruvate-binding domain-containing protein [Phycisphaerae bacterium]
AYRLQRGLDRQDEQMALLVQRVSGSYKNNHFFPDLAGVGVSYNTFVWKPELDPKAGMLRLVFGLGTRAVDRVEDDYPQTIALDQPLLRLYADREGQSKFTQRNVDLLDTSDNSLKTVSVVELLGDELDISSDLIAEPDLHTEQKIREMGMKARRCWILTFKKLLSHTNFIEIMQKILKNLERYYHYPVDVEFTVNFTTDGAFKINVVQCRPLQTKGIKANVRLPENIMPEDILFASQGYTMGGSISQAIKKMIYVDPVKYVETSNQQKYSIARLVGKLNRQIADRETSPTMLLGPGRWGTTTPSLGVPVNFSEINKVSILVEIAYEGGSLMPELSFGAHFFQDLVESDIFYVALFPQKETVVFNRNKITEMPNLLTQYFPEENEFEDVVKVCNVDSGKLQLLCDVVSQNSVCFFT